MTTILFTRYKDASKTSFKSSTRLECMMQDYPKNLPPSARVGYTVMEPWLAAYAPMKNNPEDAAMGVPLMIEIGPRDAWSQRVVVSRRDGPGKQGKVFEISLEHSVLEAYIKDKLDDIQTLLLEKAKSFRDSNIVVVRSCDKLKIAISQGKWARGNWSASDEDE